VASAAELRIVISSAQVLRGLDRLLWIYPSLGRGPDERTAASNDPARALALTA
jgi:hypothetical protein